MKPKRARIHWTIMAGAVLATTFMVRAVSAQPTTRVVGTITAINGNTITVKSDASGERQIDVSADTPIKRVEPGQRDLSSAETIQLTDLSVNDRVLVKLDPLATGPVARALQIIAIKKADLAARQQKEREDWQRRGVGGLVKSVDPTAGIILLTSGAGSMTKAITVKVTGTTVLRRYAEASVDFAAAKPAPLSVIQPGDQLRARGQKNSEGTEIEADEIVSGTFRNISGTIISLDTDKSLLVVRDLATKKQVTVHMTQDAQMRKLPEMMAKMLAARLKGGSSAPSGSAAGGGPASSPGGQSWTQHGGGQGGRGAGSSGDTQQILNRLPGIQLSDLKKGDAVMLVSTDGASDVTGITLLAGVEPLLEAPEASQSLLNNWSLGSGSPEAAAQ